MADHRSRARIIRKLKTIGVADRIKHALHGHLRHLMQMVNVEQDDIKNRHYVLLIFTHEGTNDDTGNVAVATDLITSLSPEDSVEFVADWLQNIAKRHP
jgi:hypothetical protein